MKKFNMLRMLMFIMTGLAVLSGCSSNDDMSNAEGGGSYLDGGAFSLTRNVDNNSDGTVIEYFERNGMKFHLLDLTEQYAMATYIDKDVPVSHVSLELLPEGIREVIRMWGKDGLTVVFRMNYRGQDFYELFNLLSSARVNVFDENGKRPNLNGTTYEQLVEEATVISCILVLDTEVAKSAEGAPNYLIGIWQNDWQHLIHGDNQQATVALYPELPFSITEVLNFREDGTGYLRTVKEYKDGQRDIALDPFSYELTNYEGGEDYGYHGYYYLCHFEAGDNIEYMVRSRDNMQTLARIFHLVDYPWFRQDKDRFESFSVNVGQKYGTPAKDSSNPIVGRWTGSSYSSDTVTPAFTTTWVFRSDNTGYRLINQLYDEPFAYTVSYQGEDAELTIYKYNTGFLISEGFAKDDGLNISFDPTILPTGEVIKAKIKDDTLELEDWATYQRVD